MYTLSKSRMCTLTATAVALLALSSCVDHDYDLSEDIDMTMQIGGELLTLPTSSTDAITLSQILDLDSSSSIKTVETDGEYGLAKGDYVLVQDGNSDPADYRVPEVSLGHLNGSRSETQLPEFVNTGADRITEHATPTINNVNLSDDDVTPELVSLTNAKLDVTMTFSVGFLSDDFAGTAYINEGFKAIFDPSWTIAVDPASASFLKAISANEVEFTRECAITANAPLVAKIHLVNVDLTKVPADQGLYERGHFRLQSDIESEGDISIDATGMAIGATANLNLEVITDVQDATLIEVTGVIDPDINIDPTSFTINDIPDFLSDDDNHLDIDNPMIYFTVNNNSPLSLDVNGKLTSYKNGNKLAAVGLGKAFGTSEIVVPPTSTTIFVISRKAVSGNFKNIVVPDLGSVLETIPDEILFDNITCEALPEEATFILGNTYTFKADYEAVIPLAFGADMRLHYTHEDQGWDEDLDKYNFRRVDITLTAINTLPLAMTPEVQALGRNGQTLSNVTATIEGTVAAGSIANPSSTDLKIGELDGIRLVFDGVSAPEYLGENLNESQSLVFDNIKIQIIGGIIVDLND